MKFRNFILFIITLVGCSGCYFKTATYEIFKYKRDGELYEWNNQNIPKYHSERREIYDDNRYIYKFNGDDLRCVYGYLTNKDVYYLARNFAKRDELDLCLFDLS